MPKLPRNLFLFSNSINIVKTEIDLLIWTKVTVNVVRIFDTTCKKVGIDSSGKISVYINEIAF